MVIALITNGFIFSCCSIGLEPTNIVKANPVLDMHTVYARLGRKGKIKWQYKMIWL